MAENSVGAPNLLNIGVAFGLSGGVRQFQINLNNPDDVVQKITEITDVVKAPLLQQIGKLTQEVESLKKRTLSVEEIQRLSRALIANSSEFRADGKPTQDDLLAKRLEVWSKL